MHADVNTVILILGFLLTIGSNKLDLSRIEARLDRIEADLREFYRVQGIHEGKIDIVSKRMGL